MLNGKVALVTGAARGVSNGRSIALRLAQEGADVAVADIRFEEANEVAAEIADLGRKSKAVKIDLSSPGEVEAGLDQIKADLGPVDILVNNAAIMTNMATISKMSVQAWDKEIAVNLSGAFYCLKQVYNDMVGKKWGRIVNISSMAGMMGGYGQSSYSASKAALVGLTKTIALEGARFGITSNAITLGIFGTDTYHDLPAKVRETIARRIPIGREGSTEELAGLVAYLASDEARYLTGANVVLTGGADLFVI